jgi:hypothetical protein
LADLTSTAPEALRSATPAVAVIRVLLPEPSTQCAAVRTTSFLWRAPPQPVDRVLRSVLIRLSILRNPLIASM